MRLRLAIALALPLAALAVIWGMTWRAAQQGQEWLIPVQGYDPRDLLRGHYVRYRYDWPVDQTVPEEEGGFFANLPYISSLCIEGRAPDIARVRIIRSHEKVEGRGCAIVARASLGTRREVQGLETGILYASQQRAVDLSQKLGDPTLQGFVRVKIRADGVMRPVDLLFRPRSPD